MTSRTQRHEVFRPAIHLDVVDVCHGQSSFVRVEFIAGESALLAALLALPSGLILDRGCNLIPIVWVLRSVHRHGNNPMQRSRVSGVFAMEALSTRPVDWKRYADYK